MTKGQVKKNIPHDSARSQHKRGNSGTNRDEETLGTLLARAHAVNDTNTTLALANTASIHISDSEEYSSLSSSQSVQ